MREMKSASSWPRVLRLTYAAVLPLYFACGMLGYAAYGDFANANINVNFPDNLANQASIVVQMVQEVGFLRSCRPRHAANLTLTPTFTLTLTLIGEKLARNPLGLGDASGEGPVIPLQSGRGVHAYMGAMPMSMHMPTAHLPRCTYTCPCPRL
jgi:hypothetical protein